MAKVLQAQYDGRVAAIIGDDQFTIEAIIKREGMRMEAQGLITALRLPNVILETTQDSIEQTSKEIPSDDTSGTDPGSGDFGDTPITSGDGGGEHF